MKEIKNKLNKCKKENKNELLFLKQHGKKSNPVNRREGERRHQGNGKNKGSRGGAKNCPVMKNV